MAAERHNEPGQDAPGRPSYDAWHWREVGGPEQVRGWVETVLSAMRAEGYAAEATGLMRRALAEAVGETMAGSGGERAARRVRVGHHVSAWYAVAEVEETGGNSDGKPPGGAGGEGEASLLRSRTRVRCSKLRNRLHVCKCWSLH